MLKSDQLVSLSLLPLETDYSAIKHIASPSPFNTSVFNGCRQEKGDHGNAQITTKLQNMTKAERTAAATKATAQSLMAVVDSSSCLTSHECNNQVLEEELFQSANQI